MPQTPEEQAADIKETFIETVLPACVNALLALGHEGPYLLAAWIREDGPLAHEVRAHWTCPFCKAKAVVAWNGVIPAATAAVPNPVGAMPILTGFTVCYERGA